MFAGDMSFADDVTFVLLRAKPGEQLPVLPVKPTTFSWEPAIVSIESLKEFDRAFAGWLDAMTMSGEIRSNLILSGRELVTNAIRYTPNSAPFCRVDVRIRNDSVILTVSDNGPFFDIAKTIEWETRRIDATPHDKESGRGLYLVSRLAKKIICEELVGRKKIVATFPMPSPTIPL